MRHSIAIFGLVLGSAIGCGSSPPPKELMDARTAYMRAASGPAATTNPVVVRDARKALALAERSYSEEGDSKSTRDLGYVAEREAQRAQVLGQEMLAHQQVQLTSAEMEKRAEQALVQQQRALQEEKQRRHEADMRAQQAAADLSRIAAVKQEARGTVITLPGNVFFGTGKSELRPTAQARLSEVASVLLKAAPDQTIIVEGYTDSTGKPMSNQELSQKRAEAVRDYLVSHGMSRDRISAKGMGTANPISSNTSPEGRASNRRVEIVISSPGGAEKP